MSVHHFQFRFIYNKKTSNIAGHLNWLAYIASPQFAEDWHRRLLSQSNLKELVKQAQQVVEEEIYSHGQQSGRIKKSIEADVQDSDNPQVTIFSNPATAPSKGPFESGDPSSFSYMAFFEEPAFHTFLPPKDNPYDSRRYRPFMEPMTQANFQKAKEMMRQSIFKTIRQRMPRLQAAGE